VTVAGPVDPAHRTGGPDRISALQLARSGFEPTWWRHAAIYQIYPRSFADGNGDQIGDLRGILDRVDYLERLGIDAVWLSPFYPSALADGGYDVDDYRDVDPRIGTLEDFDELVTALHERGLKLVIDIVPNHSSDRHERFRAAVEAGPGSPERDWYILRDGTGPADGDPPAEWESVFGGPAWTQVPDGQWYLHIFAKEQPDWNWAHPGVREDFLSTLRFWADRGVDGFRIDVASLLTKALPPGPLPPASKVGMDKLFSVDPQDYSAYPDGQHPLKDRDEVHDIYATWRDLFNQYQPALTAVAEAWVPAHRRVRYASATGLGQAFNFDLLRAPWEAARFRAVIEENLQLAARSGASTTWVLSNHDVVRHATRYGISGDENAWLCSGGTAPREDRVVGLRRARAASLLIMALPGCVYLYQGEELGLPEVVDIPPDVRQDPTFFRSEGAVIGRDGCRVPMPWTAAGPSYGFGTAGAHLPQPTWFADYAVEVQQDKPNSTLTPYRHALRIRHDQRADENLEWLESTPDVIAFRRSGGWISVTNFGNVPVPAPAGRLLLASEQAPAGLITPNSTHWLREP
jgi:alpha-glucosidase